MKKKTAKKKILKNKGINKDTMREIESTLGVFRFCSLCIFAVTGNIIAAIVLVVLASIGLGMKIKSFEK